MPDGAKRRRRNRGDARAKFYALYRSARFRARFGGIGVDMAEVCAIMKKNKGMNT